MTVQRKYTWHPSRPSINTVKLTLPNNFSEFDESDIPTEHDMITQFPVNYDQQNIGSCVDNGIAALIERLIIRTKYRWQFKPSRLFAYYNARSLEGTTSSDSGSSVADGINSVNQFGICPEMELDGTAPDWIWPYDTSKYADKPPDACYKDAVLHKALKAHAVDLNRATVLQALLNDIPFAFGFTVHQSFESDQMAKTGIMHIPQAFDLFDPEIGGHCVVAIGYKLDSPMGDQGVKDWVLCRNSWGTQWGVNGNFWMPLNQILCNPNVASDAHAIDLVGI